MPVAVAEHVAFLRQGGVIQYSSVQIVSTIRYSFLPRQNCTWRGEQDVVFPA